VTESLRDRVQAAVHTELDHLYGSHMIGNEDAAVLVTSAVFDTLNGARPCVTCGKSIGPNKVAKGYVQCYGCSRSTPATSGALLVELAEANDRLSMIRELVPGLARECTFMGTVHKADLLTLLDTPINELRELSDDVT
jgi:hypothetical protein